MWALLCGHHYVGAVFLLCNQASDLHGFVQSTKLHRCYGMFTVLRVTFVVCHAVASQCTIFCQAYVVLVQHCVVFKQQCGFHDNAAATTLKQ